MICGWRDHFQRWGLLGSWEVSPNPRYLERAQEVRPCNPVTQRLTTFSCFTMAAPALLMSSGLGSWSPGCVHSQQHSLPLGSFCPSSEPLKVSWLPCQGQRRSLKVTDNRLGTALVGFLKSASPPPRTSSGLKHSPQQRLFPSPPNECSGCLSLWAALVCVLPRLKAVPSSLPLFLLPHLSRGDLESGSCPCPRPSHLSVLCCVPSPAPQAAGVLCWGPGGHSDVHQVIIHSGGTWRTNLHENHNMSRTSAAEIRCF